MLLINFCFHQVVTGVGVGFNLYRVNYRIRMVGAVCRCAHLVTPNRVLLLKSRASFTPIPNLLPEYSMAKMCKNKLIFMILKTWSPLLLQNAASHMCQQCFWFDISFLSLFSNHRLFWLLHESSLIKFLSQNILMY